MMTSLRLYRPALVVTILVACLTIACYILLFEVYDLAERRRVKSQSDDRYQELREPTDEQLRNRRWKRLQCAAQSLQLFAFSAFYDDREFRAGAGPLMIRVMTVMHLKRATLYCLLWYKGRAYPEVVTAPGFSIGVGVLINGIEYQEVVCNCPVHSPETVPSFVSLVCDPRLAPQFYLPVEIPAKPAVKKDFAICVCASYDSRDPYRLIEWMTLQKLWGVDKVTVYNNTINDETAEVLLYFAKLGFVEFRQSPPFMPNMRGKFGAKLHKTPTINDCFYRNMHSYKKLLVIDFDEMIVPRNQDNLKDLLTEIDLTIPNNPHHDARTYSFRNDYFFLDLPQDLRQPEKLVTLRHRLRLPPSETGYSAKSITDPQGCVAMHHHFCWRKARHHSNPDHLVYVKPSLAMNHHYKMCHFKKTECHKRLTTFVADDTMLRFKDFLLNHTVEHIKLLGLPPL